MLSHVSETLLELLGTHHRAHEQILLHEHGVRFPSFAGMMEPSEAIICVRATPSSRWPAYEAHPFLCEPILPRADGGKIRILQTDRSQYTPIRAIASILGAAKVPLPAEMTVEPSICFSTSRELSASEPTPASGY
jgi:hypothetical protein